MTITLYHNGSDPASSARTGNRAITNKVIDEGSEGKEFERMNPYMKQSNDLAWPVIKLPVIND